MNNDRVDVGSDLLVGLDNEDFWQEMNEGLWGGHIETMAVDILRDVIYAGTFGGGVFRSADGGGSWQAVNSGLTNLDVRSFAISGDGRVYAGTFGGVFRSRKTILVSMPKSIALAADTVVYCSAYINGTVESGDQAAFARFMWGIRPSELSNQISVSDDSIKAMTTTTLQARLTGLRPGTTYYYTLVASNPLGTSYGDTLWFTTLADQTAPYVTAVTPVNGAKDVLPATPFVVRIKDDESGINRSTLMMKVNGVQVEPDTSGNEDEVILTYRPSSGWTPGEDVKIVIGAEDYAGNLVEPDSFCFAVRLGPEIKSVAAADFGLTSAKLTGVVNPHGIMTSFYFEYGTNASYGLLAVPSPAQGDDTSDVVVSAIVQGLFPDREYHYRLVAVSGTDTNRCEDHTFRTLADMVAPVIVHSERKEIPRGTSLSVEAMITDNYRIKSAVLHYRRGGEAGYTVANMIPSGNRYSGTIPSSAVTERGLEYYIAARDSADNESTMPADLAGSGPFVVQVRSENLLFPQATAAGLYRMFSVPVYMDDITVASQLVDDLGPYDKTKWRLYRCINDQYVEYGSMGFAAGFVAGHAFWLITQETTSIDVGPGVSAETGEPAVIELQPGWNQIGNPFAFPVYWRDVVKPSEVEDLVRYTGTANEKSYNYNYPVLQPWEGYFVKSNAMNIVRIKIPAKEATGLEKAVVENRWDGREFENGEWVVRLEARCGNCVDRDNYIGCMQGASTERDEWDISEAPVIDEYVSLYFPHQTIEGKMDKCTGDFRPIMGQGEYWDIEVETNLIGEVVVKIIDQSRLSEGLEMILLDFTGGIKVDMKDAREYRYYSENHSKLRRLRLIAGEADYVAEQGAIVSDIPGGWELHPNYPNPFNNETRIEYTVPETGDVEVSVYNINGQLIRKLHAGIQSPGRYSVIWHGEDENSETVSSGLYIVRLRSGKYHKTQKTVFTR